MPDQNTLDPQPSQPSQAPSQQQSIPQQQAPQTTQPQVPPTGQTPQQPTQPNVYNQTTQTQQPQTSNAQPQQVQPTTQTTPNYQTPNPAAQTNYTQTSQSTTPTQQTPTSDVAPPKTSFSNQKVDRIIYLVLGIIETLMVLRLVFRLLNANPDNSLINLIYSVTSPLIEPFRNIFNTSSIDQIIEIPLLLSMVFYALFAYGVSKLFKVLQSQ